VIHIGSEEKAPVVTICGKLEAELEDLGEEERKEFLKEYGLQQSGLEILVAEGYHLLNLMVFLYGREQGIKSVDCGARNKGPRSGG